MALALQSSWLVAAAVVAGTTVLSVLLMYWSSQFRMRTIDLTSAAEALDAHYDAVARIVDDPAVSDKFKDGLLLLSGSVSDREIARQLLASFYDGSLFKAPIDDDASLTQAELERLKAHRPDLLQDFQTAIGAGLAALFLRWPETAAIFKQMAASMAADQRKEITLVNQVSVLGTRKNSGNHDQLATATC